MAAERPAFDPKMYDHVEDADVRKSFIEMRETMEEVAKVRSDLREKRNEKEEQREALKDEREKISTEIDKVQADIELLRNKLTPSKEETIARQNRSRKYDRKKVLLISLQCLQGKIGIERERVNVYITKAERLNKQLKKLEENMPKEKSVNDCKNKIERLTQKIAVADANKDANLKKLVSDRSALEKAKEKLEDIAQVKVELEEQLVAAESHNPKVTEDEIKRVEDELKELKDEIEAWEKANPQKKDEEIAAERKAKDAVRAEIDEKKKVKQALIAKKDEVGQSPEMQAAFESILKNKEELEKKIKACEDAIPKEVVTIGEDLSMYDINRARRETFEADFGVVIDLRRQEGQIVIRGSQCEDCAESIKATLQECAKNRCTQELTIDPELVYEFIGQGGQRIQMLQTNSGTNIDLDKATGSVTVTGSAENIENAMQMINEFKESSHRETVSYPKALDTVLRPKIAKQWQDDFDVRSIRIRSEESKIVILGKAESAKAAAAEISDILNNMGDNIINIPSNVSHYAVIGTKGSRVNEIQSITKCFVDVTETKVTILGKKDAIEEAKKLVEAIIKDNIREETRIPYNTRMHNMLMRQRKIEVPETEEKHVDPEAEGKAEEEAEEEEAKEKEGKKDQRPPRTHECLLETLRKKHGCDRLQADLKTKTIFIRGPKDAIPRVTKDLQDVLAFKGFARCKLQLDLPVVRWLTVNKQQEGKKGVVTRLDAVRAYEGIEEIVADFRAESKDVEIIGTEEGVAKAKARIEQLAGICKAHSMTFDIPATSVGRLLGSRGATRQEIENDYDVMIHTPARNDDLPRDAEVTITIIGRDMRNTEEACQAAIRATDDWNRN